METLLTRIREQSAELPPNQRVLARHLLENYQSIAFSTIRQVAQASGVSEATIVRFSRLMGFAGYADLQKEARRVIREDLKGTDRFTLSLANRPAHEGTLSATIDKELENITCLQGTFSAQELARATGALRSAGEVHVIGARSSAALAQHLWFGLDKIELRATRWLDVSSTTFQALAKLPEDAVVVVISFPRYLTELVEVTEMAKGRGLGTICITDSPSSPLLGDINLYSPAESGSFIGFHCAPMILINTLLHEISVADQEATLAALSRFEQVAHERKYFHTGTRRKGNQRA